MRSKIEQYWAGLGAMAQAMPYRQIACAAELLLDSYRHDGSVFILGNGGSAATASHFACDLAKGTRCEGRRPFRVVPLTDNVPLLTAWANDTSYDQVFAEQLRSLVHIDDVVICISASGNSPNVLAAAEVANEAGARTIAMSGRTGGRLRRLCTMSILVPADAIELVEDAHLVIAHSLCVALRDKLRSERPRRLEERQVAEQIPEPIYLDIAL
jgi:D-sedoheptulose 7-phosphate isomerase